MAPMRPLFYRDLWGLPEGGGLSPKRHSTKEQTWSIYSYTAMKTTLKLGKLDLRKITSLTIQKFLGDMRMEKLSDSYMRKL